MTIVTLVLILAAIVAPSASRTVAIYRTQTFASDVLMLARAARRDAMEGGRANVVRFFADSVGVYRGNSSLCRATDWTMVTGAECDSEDDVVAGGNCVGALSVADYSGSFHAVELAPVSDFDVCYQPNGEALAAAGDGLNFTRIAPNVAVAATFNVLRTEGGTSVDPVRTLIVPFDSAPRSGR